MIRKINHHDIDAVMGIWKNIASKRHPFIPKNYWNDNLDIVKKEYINDSDIYVYEENEKILGFMSIKNNGFIGGVFVEPSMQMKGIGSKLINFAQEKYKSLSLLVCKNNQQALDFYVEHGFKIAKEHIDKKTKECGSAIVIVMEWER